MKIVKIYLREFEPCRARLAERRGEWLLAAKVVLPGLPVLERAIARVRAAVFATIRRDALAEAVARAPSEKRAVDPGLVANDQIGSCAALIGQKGDAGVGPPALARR